MASSCAVHLPFSHRVAYTTLTQAHEAPILAPPVSIRWLPHDFSERVDSVSPSGFVGSATRARIPTGPALSSRITEVLDYSVGVGAGQRPLTIIVLGVETEYEYSANLLNAGLAIDRAKCVVDLELRYGGKQWTQRFEAEEIDEHIGGASITGPLERVWDRLAIDIGHSVTAHVAGADS